MCAFTGAPDSAAVTVVGINNVLAPTLDGYGLTLAYYIYEASDSQWHLLTGSAAPPVDVGTYTVTASFPGRANYGGQKASTAFAIWQAVPIVTVTDAAGVYSGNAYPATPSVAGVNGTAASSLAGVTPALTYYDNTGHALTAAPSAAGQYIVVASYAGTTDYVAATSAPVAFAIKPVRAWPSRPCKSA